MEDLEAGEYTIEATTHAPGLTGDFTLTATLFRIPSNAAALKGLNLEPASVSLVPAFAASTESYTASVGNAVTTVQVTPTVNHADAAVTVNGAAVASGQASQPIDLSVGANTITIVVTAQDGTTTKTYTVVVTRAAAGSGNRAPTVDAGSDQEVEYGELVTLSGAGTDPDGDSLTYAWTQTGGPTVTLSSPTQDGLSTTASFRAPSSETTLTFTLKVSDGKLSDTDTVTVSVRGWTDTGRTRCNGLTKEKEQSRTSSCGNRQARWVGAPEAETWGSWSDTGRTADLGATKEQSRTSNCGNRETRWIAVPETWSSWSDTGARRGSGSTREKEQSRTSNLGRRQTRWVADPEPETWGGWSRTGSTRGSGRSREAEEARTSSYGRRQTRWAADPEPETWGGWSRTGSTRGSGRSREAEEARTSSYGRRQTRWVVDPEPETWGPWSDTGRTGDLGATKEQERTSNYGNRQTRWVSNL